ncbi:MAG: hypothetical protein ACYDCQ_04960 [Dehalococcoidia bacterium]
MPSAQTQEIKDAALRGLLERAEAMLDAGDNGGCVHACAEAYLMLLSKNPLVLMGLRTVLATPRVKAGLENGTLRFAPLMFPRLAAKLTLPEDGPPAISFTREQMGFGEAVQYYEFTLNLVADAEQGIVRAE